MATADEIGANFSNYQGSAALAGGNFGAITVDTRPLQNLAAYTMLFNRTKWEQEKQATDAKITQLADLSTIALNNLRGKDKDQAAKEFAELQKYASEYARKIPKTPQERIQDTLDWQTKYGAFKNNYNSGKDRAVTYAKRYSDIKGSNKSASTQDAEIAALDREFDNTGIETKISGVANFKTTVPVIPDPISQKFTTIGIGDNVNASVDVGYYNPLTNSGPADAAILNIKKVYPKEGTPEYQSLSQSEKEEAKVQATIDSDAKVWLDAIEPLNAALKPYVNADGIFDSIGFENDNASNTTLMSAYNALKRYNAYNRQKFDQAEGGLFSDKGLSVKLPENVNANDFKVGFVDFAKGVNANQLVQSGMFAKYTGDTITNKKITETDDAIQREELRLRWANYGLEKEKLNKATNEDLLAADGVLREITDIVNKGDMPDNQVDVVDGNTGKTKRVFKIGDPTILQKFGNIDKDGTTTNVPDEARYNPKTNEIDLVYFERDDDGNVKHTQTRGSYIKETKTLNSRTWANMVSQRTFSGQDRGQVNEIIQNVITKNGGDLYKIAKGLNQSVTPSTETKSTPKGGGMTDAEFDEFLKKNKLKK